MILKVLGAIMVILGCGGFGLTLVFVSKNEIDSLKQFLTALEYMHWELEYKLTPLPELFRRIATICNGTLREYFETTAQIMERQSAPNAQTCLIMAMDKTKHIPKHTRNCVISLSKSLGQYDLSGQINGIQSVKNECKQKIDVLSQNKDVRFRSYQTLGLCAGAAIAVLFI